TIPFTSLTSVENLQILTRGGNDTVIFDLSSHADSILSRFVEVEYDGGSPNTLPGDSLRFIGDGVTRSIYTPSASQTGSGVVIVNRGSLETRFEFSSLEPVDFTG